MGISIWQLLIVLGIVILLFGTKKLRHIGTDLGGALRGFKKAMSDDEKLEDDTKPPLEGQTDKPLYQTRSEDKTHDKPNS